MFGREVPKGSRELLFCIGLGYHVFSVKKLHPFHMFHHKKHPDLFVVLWLEDYDAARAFNIRENIQEAVWCSGNALNWRGRELAPGFSFSPDCCVDLKKTLNLLDSPRPVWFDQGVSGFGKPGGR